MCIFYDCYQLIVASFIPIKSITVLNILSGEQTPGFQVDATAHVANLRGVTDSILQRYNKTKIVGDGRGYQDKITINVFLIYLQSIFPAAVFHLNEKVSRLAPKENQRILTHTCQFA